MTYALAAILALVGTVLIMVLVTPSQRYAELNPFFKAVADIFNFKGLLLEHIVKTLYIFLTLLYILSGFFLLFQTPGVGLLLMVLGPIAMRIIFESSMMFIILVKNVIQINNKLQGQGEAPVAAPAPKKEPEPKMVFCTKCGTRYDANQGGCPNGCQK